MTAPTPPKDARQEGGPGMLCTLCGAEWDRTYWPDEPEGRHSHAGHWYAPPKDAPSDVERVRQQLMKAEWPKGGHSTLDATLDALARIVAHAEALEAERDGYLTFKLAVEDILEAGKREGLDPAITVRGIAALTGPGEPRALSGIELAEEGIRQHQRDMQERWESVAGPGEPTETHHIQCAAVRGGGCDELDGCPEGPGEPERTKDEPVWCVCGAAEAVPGYERVCPGHTAQPTPSPEATDRAAWKAAHQASHVPENAVKAAEAGCPFCHDPAAPTPSPERIDAFPSRSGPPWDRAAPTPSEGSPPE